MEHNLNKKDIEKWKENLLSIEVFQSKYPSLYTLSISEWAVLKYTDSTNEEYLLWITINWNISLFNDIDRYLLDAFEEDALIELHTTKLEVNNKIKQKSRNNYFCFFVFNVLPFEIWIEFFNERNESHNSSFFNCVR